MQGTSRRPSKWMWLVPLGSIVFLILSLRQGTVLLALGWLCFLVNGVLVASGLHIRYREFSYLALAFALSGMVLLVTWLIRNFFS